MVRLLSFFLFVSFYFIGLSGCGGKAPNEEGKPAEKVAEAVKVPELPKDTRPVIACFGDSITAGYGLEAGKTYPDILQQLLDAEGYGYRVVNLGISGDTTQGALDRLQTVLELKPKITVLEIGGNDGLRGIAIERSRDNLQQMAAQIQASGSKVMIAGITLPRNYGPEYIRNFEAMYAQVAKKSGDVFVPFVLEGIWNKPGMMQGDLIHPTAAGAEQMAKNLLVALKPVLKK